MVDQAARARRFVYDELVATETDYIRDLKAVIQVRCLVVMQSCIGHMTVT